MKRGAILLVALVLMSIPISANAQTTGLHVDLIGTSIENEAWMTVTLSVYGVYGIYADVYLNGACVLYAEADFPTNDTNIWGFEIPTGGPGENEVLMQFWSCDAGTVEEFKATFGYTIAEPELVWQEGEPWPFADHDESPEPWPENELDSLFSNTWFLLLIGFAIFLGFAGIMIPQPEETKQETNNSVFRIRQYKETLRRVYPDTIIGIKMPKVDMPNVYPCPEEKSIPLPDLSSPDDDVDWRVCPWCGTWTHGEKTRCIYCDGRLGRPLGRNTK